MILTQSVSSGFPDRTPGGRGLRADCGPGLGGRTAVLELAETVSPCHVRFVFMSGDFSGGTVTIAGGHATDGSPGWTLMFDPDAARVTLAGPYAANWTADLAPGKAWRCVEVGYAPGDGVLRLWIDGVFAGESALDPSAPPLGRVWLGGVYKHRDAVGTLSFDEWVVASDYIGPVVVPPSSPYADDPAAWLVVYNHASPDGALWAAAYRAARGVPLANVLGLDLPTAETIDAAAYESLRAAIADYLDRNGLRTQIMGLLLGYAVPGYVAYPSAALPLAVASLLQTDATTLATAYQAGVTDTVQPRRPIADGSPPAFRLTARIDAPSLADAIALTDRAVVLQAVPLTAEDRLWIDRFPSIASFQPMSDELSAWAEGLDRQRLRLATRISELSDGPEPTGFDALDRDAFYWGWGQTQPPAGYFDAADGRRAVLVQLRWTSPSTATLRSSDPDDWAGRALQAGYAAVVVATRSASLSEVPLPRPFFAALRAGWTLAEAWAVSQLFPRGAYYLVGDPLLRVAVPRAGWDMYGPIGRAEDFDPGVPAAALPDGVTEWTPTAAQRPATQEPQRFWVRRRDRHGRSDGVTRPLALAAVNDAAAGVPTAPAWPDWTGWTLDTSGDSVAATLLFASPPANGALASLDLLDDRGGPPLPVAPPRHDVWVRVSFSHPDEATRYRWRWTTPAGLAATGAWSQVIQPAGSPAGSLRPWEPRDAS
ncbi:MAG: hypothetical protein AAF800_09500 [Planctomycetota bacterium]